MSKLSSAARDMESAESDVTKVQSYLATVGPALAEKIQVKIDGANWIDGSQQLANAIQAVVRTKLLEVAQEAVAVYEARMDDARDRLAEELSTRPDMASQADAQRRGNGRAARAPAEGPDARPRPPGTRTQLEEFQAPPADGDGASLSPPGRRRADRPRGSGGASDALSGRLRGRGAPLGHGRLSNQRGSGMTTEDLEAGCTGVWIVIGDEGDE